MSRPSYTQLFATDALLPLSVGAALTAASPHGTLPLLLGAFVVSGAWDVVLRLVSLGAVPTFGLQHMCWIAALQPYFDYHKHAVGVAYAAAAAGGAAAMAYGIIAWYRPASLWRYFVWIFTVSALVGLPMRVGPWYKKLQETYYNEHPYLTLLTDGLSGIIVAATMFAGQMLVHRGQ
jgi:hypothetical protein